MRDREQTRAHGALQALCNAQALLVALFIINGAASPSGVAALLSVQERPSVQERRAPEQGRATEQRRATERTTVPRAVRFREEEGRGLLVRTWVNGAGPYTFAIDTGAGATILSRRVAAEARVPAEGGRALEINGLSGVGVRAARRAFVQSLSIGDAGNFLPAAGLCIVAEGLPADLDGVLDPTEAFAPLGYVVDFPASLLVAFDPRLNPLRRLEQPADGAVVAWLSDAASRRPFVMLSNNQRALLDTGSGFGLAVTETAARTLGLVTDRRREREGVRDIAGGQIGAHRVREATVQIGALALRGVPTDLLHGAESGAPVLLGRDALRPFQLTFDPLNRLIRIKAR